jgi:mono/diheme cytochrome c family protein
MKRASKREHREEARRNKQRQRMILALSVIGVISLILFVVLLLGDGSGNAADLPDDEVIAQGLQIYTINCAACHGVNLEGQADWQQKNPDGSLRAPPHDETGHTWHHGDTALIEFIKLGGARLPANLGLSAMPAYNEILTDPEISAVLDYIKSTWPNDIVAMQQSR